jgi:signal transduction histidine kinase
LVVALADLMPVPIWGSVELMMSFPVLLACAFVFPPYAAGLLAMVGTVDAREFKREIPWTRALFNRSNVALSVTAASWVFHSLDVELHRWPLVAASASLGLIVDLALNASLVVVGTWLLTGVPVRRIVLNVYGGSQPAAFIGGYLCFGLMALVLATMYEVAGTWGLMAFAIPVLLARQMFVQWKRLATVQTQLRQERQMLTRVTRRIADERRDERLAVAAGIHDDILPPLYKVHLMGQVLRQDLASGRLLDLESDLPELLEATEAASHALRDLIGDLRKSTLGPGGLPQTLELLARSLEAESKIRIDVEVEPVPGTPLTHLLLYQVAKEALTNVVRHSRASAARVVLQSMGNAICLRVEDNGTGFEPSLVDRDRHFGLQLMRERVELAGGTMWLQTSSRTGTSVAVEVPIDEGPPR